MGVLVDSSIWIAAQVSNARETVHLKELLLENHSIYTSRIIQVEVTQGAKTQELFTKLWNGFLGLNFLEITDTIWQKAAVNYFLLRKKGLTISTIDSIIATLAIENRVGLWSKDKVFEKMTKHLTIKLYEL